MKASLVSFNDKLAIEERLSAKDIKAKAKTSLDEALMRNKKSFDQRRQLQDILSPRRGALLGTRFRYRGSLSAHSKKKRKASLISSPSENQFATSCLSK